MGGLLVADSPGDPSVREVRERTHYSSEMTKVAVARSGDWKISNLAAMSRWEIIHCFGEGRGIM
ncbi:MAG: hypothetical protein D6720_02015 [Gammaproteobacteria bacterium]|nr:MAG: hypothetical protein D6720_02015 [Gammaproteobacteria bacterium]